MKTEVVLDFREVPLVTWRSVCWYEDRTLVVGHKDLLTGEVTEDRRFIYDSTN